MGGLIWAGFYHVLLYETDVILKLSLANSLLPHLRLDHISFTFLSVEANTVAQFYLYHWLGSCLCCIHSILIEYSVCKSGMQSLWTECLRSTICSAACASGFNAWLSVVPTLLFLWSFVSDCLTAVFFFCSPSKLRNYHVIPHTGPAGVVYK